MRTAVGFGNQEKSRRNTPVFSTSRGLLDGPNLLVERLEGN